MAYAVRSGSTGQVFDQLDDARTHYHTLQRRGAHPVLGVFRSLTEAVSFIEAVSAERAERQHWIREELAAHAAMEQMALSERSTVSDVSSLSASEPIMDFP